MMDNTENTGMPQGGETPGMSPAEGGKKSSSVGPLVGIIIIVAVLVVGAFYFWGRELAEAPGTETDPVTDELMDTSDSDELDAIENDLDTTNLDSLEGDLDTVDQEV